MLVVLRQVVDGYFVHYFAPSGLQPVDKNIVFVIDTSGSMGGTKIKQTIEAMDTVLQDLRPGDAFNVLTFDGDVSYWSATGMVPADEVNILAAKTFVASLEADGCKYYRSSFSICPFHKPLIILEYTFLLSCQILSFWIAIVQL